MTFRITLAAAAAVASILSIASAVAGPVSLGDLTVNAQSAANATSAPFLLANPGVGSASGPAHLLSTNSVSIGNGATVSFTETRSPDSGIWTGSTSGTAVSPFTGTNITKQTAYFAAEPNDPVTITFNTAVKQFSLLWGSVDSYNNLQLDFYNQGKLVDSQMINGDTVALALGDPTFDNGTKSAFVELSDTTAFSKIVLTSDCLPAFEFVPQQVPEPMSIALLGAGISALAVAKRRRRAVSASA